MRANSGPRHETRKAPANPGILKGGAPVLRLSFSVAAASTGCAAREVRTEKEIRESQTESEEETWEDDIERFRIEMAMVSVCLLLREFSRRPSLQADSEMVGVCHDWLEHLPHGARRTQSETVAWRRQREYLSDLVLVRRGIEE